MTKSLEATRKFQTYKQRMGHDINGIRPVMIPDDSGEWVNRYSAEHLAEQLKRAQRRIDELEARPLCVNPDHAMREVAPLCVKLPPEFISEHGVVVQLEKVMAALAVNGIKYERRNQQVVGLRAGIESIRSAGIGVDVDKIAAEKCHK